MRWITFKNSPHSVTYDIVTFLAFQIFIITFTGYNQSVKSICIQSFSGLYFPAFGPNTEIYGVSLPNQSKCGKTRTRKTLNTDTFYAINMATEGFLLAPIPLQVKRIFIISNFEKLDVIIATLYLLTRKYFHFQIGIQSELTENFFSKPQNIQVEIIPPIDSIWPF